jgi:hypothetical protein
MQRHRQSLGAVNVGKAGRVGDDGVGDEWLLRNRVWLNTGCPAASKDIMDHRSFPPDISST